MTLDSVKEYLNITPSNITQDGFIQLLMDSATLQATRITDAQNALIDLAILKDIATNYLHRENYLDVENAGLMLSQTTIKILNQYRTQLIF